MNDNLKQLIAPLVGKPCCRRRVWRGRSLSLGFGKKVFHENERLIDSFYGEWEIGSYYGCWRVVKEGKMLLGSQDAVDKIDDLDGVLQRIEIGRVVSVRHLTSLDIRVDLDNGVAVDFLAMVSDDECFHICCPGDIYAEFKVSSGWEIGPSNKPWK